MKVIGFAIDNIPLVKPDDDLARLITERTELEEHDIVVISSTVVSKSENRILSLNKMNVTPEAVAIAKRNGNDPRFIQAVMNESSEVFLESPFLLVLTKNGSICVNAGIDRSNVDGQENILLLPKSPDESARKIKDSLFQYSGKRVSVIITDTNGRAFRIGQTGAAIGIAGIKPTVDWRGTKDLFGRVLEVKNEAVVDEIAGFANILMGEGDSGKPIVVIRGLSLYHESYGINELYRPEKEDEIRRALIRSQSA